MEKVNRFFGMHPEIPLALKICAGTDGTVTGLLELITGATIEITTLEQKVVKPDGEICKLLDIGQDEDVNYRIVLLTSKETVFGWAKSLSPMGRMPPHMKEDIMRRDMPIGKILRRYRLETLKDILTIELTEGTDELRELFGEIAFLSRTYTISNREAVLLWINEIFPVDDRWVPE